MPVVSLYFQRKAQKWFAEKITLAEKPAGIANQNAEYIICLLNSSRFTSLIEQICFLVFYGSDELRWLVVFPIRFF